LSRLASEIAALNARIETLARPGAPGIDPAVLATLNERIDRLSGALAASERRLAGIESRSVPQMPDLAPLANRIGVLEGMLETLRRELGDIRRLAEQPPPPRTDATTSLIAAEIVALETMRDAIEAGTPFAAELAAVRKLLGERAAPLAALDQAASEGLPTTATLARRLSELMPALTRAPDPQGGFLDRLIGSAGRLVEVRRVGEPSGTDLSAIATRMETRLQRGDLAGALEEAALAPALAQGPAASWLAAAKMRRDAEANLKTLIAASLAALKSEPSR
jgi:hypothetical protein